MSEYDESAPPKPSPLPPPTELTRRDAPALTADTVDEFLRWAASVPVGEVAVIREYIAAARGDDSLLDRLIAELWTLPVQNVGRHSMLLSTLGELRDGRAASALARFVWHQDLMALSPPEGQPGCGFEAHPAEALQARAAEMLSYLGTEEAVEETLRIAAEHPRAGVRAAAIDAHLFNHDDSSDELNRLRSRVRAEDQPLVGVPRLTRGSDPQQFERAVRRFYEQYPDQLPPEIELRAVVEPPSPRPAR
jgi:hypothetical protein